MFELILGALLYFALHFLIGATVVVAAAWLLRRLVRGWLVAGARLPAGLLTASTVCVWCVVAGTALLTGAQTGTIAVLDRLIETQSQSWTEQALLLAGKPIGITSAEQKFGPEDLRALADRIAPGLTQKSLDAVGADALLERVDAEWQKLPEFVRTQTEAQLPATEWSIRDIVGLAWRQLLKPAVVAAKVQALLFAYGLAAALVLPVLVCDLLLRAWSRRQ